MAKAKKAPKKATKRAPSDALAQAREKHKAEREHVGGKLKTAHRAVLSVVDRVHADDAEGIARLRRAIDHIDSNARARGGR